MKRYCAVRVTSLWAVGVAIICTPPCNAQSFTTLDSFIKAQDGESPYAGLVQATNGDLYGTTLGGGKGSGGTVFQITPSGTLTTLYNFCTQTNCPDGQQPRGGLVQGTDGNLYGTTFAGGRDLDCNGQIGCGTVFKITPSGTLTTLYQFCAQTNCADGSGPYSGLIQGSDGNFYGTTWGGGLGNGCGTVFKITPSGTLTTLYQFCTSGTDGFYPYAALVQGADGNFYGTTEDGGTEASGTVFKITPSGTLTTLHNFVGTDGAHPYAALVQGTDGNFYGTTTAGGAKGSCTAANLCGTIFKITPGGTFTSLYSFCPESGCPDGAFPYAGLVQATDGNFYGTTEEGGSGPGFGYGTAFKITPGGTLTTLYTFCTQSGCTDGSEPYGGLVENVNGSFYGTTYEGGSSNDGTLFSLAVLPPTFFANEAYLSATDYYMTFPDGNLFGYYGFLQGSGTTPAAWLYHFDLGYEYVTPGGAAGSIYFYDLSSGHWWYSSSSLFPYLYDFTLNAWVYYFANTQSPGHYSSNPRYFSNLTTGKVFTM